MHFFRTNIHRNGFSVDSRLYKDDNQLRDGGFSVSCQSFIGYQQGFLISLFPNVVHLLMLCAHEWPFWLQVFSLFPPALTTFLSSHRCLVGSVHFPHLKRCVYTICKPTEVRLPCPNVVDFPMIFSPSKIGYCHRKESMILFATTTQLWMCAERLTRRRKWTNPVKKNGIIIQTAMHQLSKGYYIYNKIDTLLNT